jgi:hypothetical protein
MRPAEHAAAGKLADQLGRASKYEQSGNSPIIAIRRWRCIEN